MSNFTCANCRETFLKETTEEEAKEELKNLFGTTLEETECVEICDVCWNKMGFGTAGQS